MVTFIADDASRRPGIEAGDLTTVAREAQSALPGSAVESRRANSGFSRRRGFQK